MADDTLERERQLNNIIDRLYKLEERVARLEERVREQESQPLVVPEPAVNGQWTLEVVDIGGEVGPMLLMVEL